MKPKHQKFWNAVDSFLLGIATAIATVNLLVGGPVLSSLLTFFLLWRFWKRWLG